MSAIAATIRPWTEPNGGFPDPPLTASEAVLCYGESNRSENAMYFMNVTSTSTAGMAGTISSQKEGEMYQVEFVPVGDNHYTRSSQGDRYGGGGSRSYLIRITRDGSYFVDTREYVEVLSPYNNRLQDEYIRKYRKAMCMVVEHDTELNEDEHVHGKARIMLDALRKHAA